MKWASWLNLIVGIWLLFAPSVLHFTGTVEAGNCILFGILAIVVSVWSLIVSPINRVPAWFNLVFGIWMFISAWFLTAGTGAVWNGVITGVLLFLFGLARMTGSRLPARPAI